MRIKDIPPHTLFLNRADNTLWFRDDDDRGAFAYGKPGIYRAFHAELDDHLITLDAAVRQRRGQAILSTLTF